MNTAEEETGGGGSTENASPSERSRDVLQRLLRVIRQHLDVDVAFVAQFVNGQRVFRYVDAADEESAVSPLDSDPLDESYCGNVAAGRLPQFLADPMQHPLSAALPVTSDLPVGTHLSVPIRFSDGRIYGTFCCFSYDVKQSVDERDLRSVEMMAEVAAEYLEAVDTAETAQREQRAAITEILRTPGALTMVFQPLRDLQTMEIVGLEALARFPGRDEGPEWMFSQAAEAGLSQELEMLAVRVALDAYGDIPPPVRLNINVGPETVTTQEFFDVVSGVDPDRLVIEVTEHAAILDYADLKVASARLTELGIWLAIDDVGMGFSGLNRILESAPEELKLDRIVIRDVNGNATKQALIEAFSSFGERAGFGVVAEGIETEAELATLRSLNVKVGQGYHLGRPVPLDLVLAELRAEQR